MDVQSLTTHHDARYHILEQEPLPKSCTAQSQLHKSVRSSTMALLNKNAQANAIWEELLTIYIQVVPQALCHSTDQ